MPGRQHLENNHSEEFQANKRVLSNRKGSIRVVLTDAAPTIHRHPAKINRAARRRAKTRRDERKRNDDDEK